MYQIFHRFKGSDDYLRTKVRVHAAASDTQCHASEASQFEEYISAALATIKYTNFIVKGESKGVLISEGYGAAII